MQGILLNSRPPAYRSRFHATFRTVIGPDWRIVDSPVLTAAPLAPVLPAIDSVDLVIFTSQMGPMTFPAVPEWRKKRALAVGEATASAAREAGFTDVLEAGPDVATLRQALSEASFAKALYASGADVTAALDEEFAGRVERIVTYQMLPAVSLSTEFQASGWERLPVIAPVFSRRSARILADLLEKAGVNKTTAHVTAIGISTDAMTDGPWKATYVAAEPTLAAVAAKVKAAADAMNG
jgi:uroporphyrinogen-III synthase